MTTHNLVVCTHQRHAQPIVDIFNDAIVNSTALYDYKPRELASMEPWFAAKEKGNFPVIGVEDANGTLLAFGSFGTFRAFPAYKYTVEHSVYVHKDHRGAGLGKVIMQALIAAARKRDVHAMMGAIDAANPGSTARATGISPCGYFAAGRLQIRALARSGVLPVAARHPVKSGGRLKER